MPYAGSLNAKRHDQADTNTDSTATDLASAKQALAEFIVEAMHALVRDGEWDPRHGAAGLRGLLPTNVARGKTEQ